MQGLCPVQGLHAWLVKAALVLHSVSAILCMGCMPGCSELLTSCPVQPLHSMAPALKTFWRLACSPGMPALCYKVLWCSQVLQLLFSCHAAPKFRAIYLVVRSRLCILRPSAPTSLNTSVIPSGSCFAEALRHPHNLNHNLLSCVLCCAGTCPTLA